MKSNEASNIIDYQGLLQIDIEKNYPNLIKISDQLPFNVLLVGAWRGDEIHSFLRWHNLGHVYAFEPNSDSFSYLDVAFKDHSKVSCFHAACGDHDGLATLYKHNTESGTESLLPLKDESSLKVVDEEKVKLVKLDSVDCLKNIDIHLFWIDVQGFELSVFQGAEKLLQRTFGIFVELNGDSVPYAGAPHYSSVDAFLTGHGFCLVHIELGDSTDGDGGVALYLREDVIGNAFDPLEVNKRVPLLKKALENRINLSKSWWYRIGSRYLPSKLKANLKRYLR